MFNFFRYHFEAESETGTSAMVEFVQGVCTGKLHATYIFFGSYKIFDKGQPRRVGRLYRQLHAPH